MSTFIDTPHLINPLLPCADCGATWDADTDRSQTMTHTTTCAYMNAMDLTDVVMDLTELVAYHGGVCSEYANGDGPAGYIVYFSPLLERRLRLGRSVRFHTAAQGRVVLKALQALPV